MKKNRSMTNPTQSLDTRLSPHAPAVLSVFRVVFGLLFLCHATSHLFGWPLASQQAPVGAWPFFYAGILELIASILITVGLFTRIAAFVASGVMAFAFFTQHLPTGVIPMTNGGELAVLYCFAFIFLVFAGGGTFALDARLQGASRPQGVLRRSRSAVLALLGRRSVELEPTVNVHRLPADIASGGEILHRPGDLIGLAELLERHGVDHRLDAAASLRRVVDVEQGR